MDGTDVSTEDYMIRAFLWVVIISEANGRGKIALPNISGAVP